MDLRATRNQLRHLQSRRRKIVGRLSYTREMVRGTFYEIRRRCGNPRCRCARGEKHPAKCLSVTEAGRAQFIYVRRKDLAWVESAAGNYRNYQKGMREIRKIEKETAEILKRIRDYKTNTYR